MTSTTTNPYKANTLGGHHLGSCSIPPSIGGFLYGGPGREELLLFLSYMGRVTTQDIPTAILSFQKNKIEQLL